MSATTASVASSPAPLWRRFAAMGYDLLPLLGLWIVAAAVWQFALYRGEDPGRLAHALHSQWAQAALDLWLLVVAGAYFVASWTRVGATIGMRAWKLRLVREDGKRIDARTAVVRYLLALVSLAALGCGFWYALSNAQRRTWHDRVCGTRMTRI